MKYLEYSNGDKLPLIGLGTWKSKQDEVSKAISYALLNGYKHIDCAAIYENESEIGAVFKDLFSSGKINREDIHITSKLWNSNHQFADVEPAIVKTLNDLKLDYLDLYLIHWPVAFQPGVTYPVKAEDFISLEDVPLVDTWKAMIELKKKGLTKHIGVSNFSIKKLEDLKHNSGVVPEVNQVEMHVYLQQPELRKYCEANGILLTGYSPLGSPDRPAEIKAENEPSLMQDPVVNELAMKYNVHAANILTAWHVNNNIATIPKSTNEKNIQSNLNSANLNFDKEDLRTLEKLDKHYRFLAADYFEMEGNPYHDIFDEQ
ncbi:MAG: aldo/keto reductase [Flavobacteriales bacterium]|nr:aldo/keto reductase [Flavobacteriales bacterium]